MRKLMLVPLALGLGLAACSAPPAAEQDAADAAAVEQNAVATVDEASNITARVVAMGDRERNVVFIRALLDADINCSSVAKSERLPDENGKPLWRADCANGGSHLITITPDGTANIISRP